MYAEPDLVLAAAAEGRLIDVRTPAEFAVVRIPGALNLPLDQLGLHAPRLAVLGIPILITCHSGKRAAQAEALLRTCGRTAPTLLVAGGTEGWRTGGGAVEQGRRTISLERQVRIVAGAIVALGALAALTISPTLAVIPLAIGSGLVFAGVSDTCLLGLGLARMPWNRHARQDPHGLVATLEAQCCSPG